MKEIRLVPDAPYSYKVDVAAMDYPQGADGPERRRLKVTVEYGKFDIDQLKKRGIDTLESAVSYYRDWIYNMVRISISSDWECIGGMDETLEIIRGYIEKYY